MKNYIIKQPYRWYAVYVKYRMEKIALSQLQKRGIIAFLPLKKEKRQWSDRVKTIEEPLLSGYLFVWVSNKEYYDVLMVNGILRYVCFEGKAAPIPEYQIEDLKLFMEHANQSTVITSGYVAKGNQVKVSYGPLKNFIGEVVEIRGKTRLLVRLDRLGCCFHVELGTNKVELMKFNQSVNKAIYLS